MRKLKIIDEPYKKDDIWLSCKPFVESFVENWNSENWVLDKKASYQRNLDDCLHYFSDREFVAYYDAFNYLRDTNCNDLKEAFSYGLTDITQIARMYLEEDIRSFIEWKK